MGASRRANTLALPLHLHAHPVPPIVPRGRARISTARERVRLSVRHMTMYRLIIPALDAGGRYDSCERDPGWRQPGVPADPSRWRDASRRDRGRARGRSSTRFRGGGGPPDRCAFFQWPKGRSSSAACHGGFCALETDQIRSFAEDEPASGGIICFSCLLVAGDHYIIPIIMCLADKWS